jgi:hypothetical protein
VRQLDADALVVGPLVVERIGQVLDKGACNLDRRREAVGLFRPLAHQRRVLGVGADQRRGLLRLRGELPRTEENGEDQDRDQRRMETQLRWHDALLRLS